MARRRYVVSQPPPPKPDPPSHPPLSSRSLTAAMPPSTTFRLSLSTSSSPSSSSSREKLNLGPRGGTEKGKKGGGWFRRKRNKGRATARRQNEGGRGGEEGGLSAPKTTFADALTIAISQSQGLSAAFEKPSWSKSTKYGSFLKVYQFLNVHWNASGILRDQTSLLPPARKWAKKREIALSSPSLLLCSTMQPIAPPPQNPRRP